MAEVTLPRHGRTTGAMSIMDAQRRSRAGLTSEREQAAGSLATFRRKIQFFRLAVNSAAQEQARRG
jgi:hypothetical protein